MAAPTVVQRFSGENASNTTSHTVTIPTVTVGNRIVVVFGCDGNTNVTYTSGWDRVISQSQGGVVRASIFEKVATSTTETLTVTTVASEQSSYRGWELNGAAPAIAAATNGNSTNADPPNLDTGFSRDYLWLACHVSDAQVVASAAPTNYGNLNTYTATTTGGASVSTAERTLTASSEDPGTFTTATEQWVGITLAFGATGDYYRAILDAPTTSDAGGGSFSWTNPTNAGTSDETYTTATLSGTTASNNLKAVGFGASIPTEASIIGIKPYIKKLRNGGTTGAARDSNLQLLKAGTATGSNLGDTGTNWLTTDETFEYGSNGGYVNLGWYPSDVNNANFGIIFSATGSTAGTDRVANVDHIRIVVYYTTPATATGAISTLVDNFDDNSTNGTLWSGAYTNNGSYSETNQQLEIAMPTSPAVGSAGYATGTVTYDLTSSAVFFELKQVVASSGTDATLTLTRDTQSYLQFGYAGTSNLLTAAKKVSGAGYTTVATATYNSTNHRWLKIRESSGTIYYDISADGLSWSNFGSLSLPFSVGALTVKLSAGTFLALSGTAIFDNFNVAPPATATPLRRMMGYG